MTSPFQSCTQIVGRLFQALNQLEKDAELLQLDPLESREWYQVLRQKLVPQIESQAFLVVAVVGGTNIGKSVVFNHIAGLRASSTSPLASGTKHPVCLVPEGFSESHKLDAIFPGFTLREWKSSDEALGESDEDTIFWRTSAETPHNLLVLDTPDIDSDARVNWKRADGIRRCADVLIAVLTQQKYNDAAVKEFFRKAASEEKATLVLFNQCQLPDDDEYWPLWMQTFTKETGIEPEFVYVAPNDRNAAENNQLSFYERTWPVAEATPDDEATRDAEATPDDEATRDAEVTRDADSLGSARSLNADLSNLHFDRIKFQTLRGSLTQLADDATGVATYLSEVKSRSNEFQAASTRLSEQGVVRITDWPSVNNTLLVGRVRDWWKERQDGWPRKIQDAYDVVGNGVLWPFRFIRDRFQGEQEPPIEEYRRREWDAILKSVEEVYDKLTWMSESGSKLLRPRLEQLLAGKSRSELLERLRTDHAAIDLDASLTENVDREMSAFKLGSPELYNFYKQLNNLSAAARPVASVVLFTLGWGPAGEVVAPMVADAAAQAMVPVVADLAGGAAAAVAGDAAVSGAAGSSLGFLQAKFQRLRSAFVTVRVNWLVERLKSELLGAIPDEFRAAGAVPESTSFSTVSTCIGDLKNAIR